MQIRPLTGALGAEILGADIRREDDFADIRQAFIDHAVIVIRDQADITPEDQLAFAERWGPINVNRFFRKLDENPRIAVVLKEPDQRRAIGERWHTDHSYDQEPAMCSILRAVEVPPFGGDTCFASMYAAHDALSERFREMLDGLVALHSSRHTFGKVQAAAETARTGRIGNPELATQDATHPVVITHPLSGRRAIYVNPDFTLCIEGLAEAESDALLKFLFAHCARPEFQCRVSWRAGDVTMWDNRATWHMAINDYHGHRRLMHRVTVEGCALSA